MNIAHYFEPVTVDAQRIITEDGAATMADCIICHSTEDDFPEIESGSIALFGVADDRNAIGNKGCANAADHIRKYLYALAQPPIKGNIYDLGNLMIGESTDDTHYAVIDVMRQLLENNVTTILIGGGQDLTYAMYKAYEMVGRVINICSVDPRFDISNDPNITSRSYLNHIVMQQPNYLFNFTTMAYQTYLVGNDHIQLMKDLNFDAYRLGYIQEDIFRAEPLVRNADMISIDISAVRQSDAPANAHPSPHGLYGEELCHITRFAGMSDKLSSLGLFELNTICDNLEQTAHMCSHALWYFIEGFFCRYNDNPYIDRTNYTQYLVQLDDLDLQLSFYKSKKSDRWWVEVPCENDSQRERYQRHLLVPCSYSDYQQALNNETPEIWWRFYQRMKW